MSADIREERKERDELYKLQRNQEWNFLEMFKDPEEKFAPGEYTVKEYFDKLANRTSEV